MAGSRQKIIETLQSVDTILVTVGKNPSVDELSAALGLTIFLNETGKHATAVMSGDIPPAISFLEPEKTFENSIDSLRDFVIALDKDKADHLRYKLVDDVVKIFITPYRSIISEKDLRYSKGDYNVELVIAIGVKTRDDLDKSLASHGRILHDATVATIGIEQSKLGDPDWFSREGSSLSEMVSVLVSKLADDKKMDKRVASALLTGIVSATDRFSNDRTTPESLSVAAELMSHGANQQLIALKLREGSKLDIKSDDGSKRLSRDFEKVDRTQKADDSTSKQKVKEEQKDKTKFSINHEFDEKEANKGGDKNNQRNQRDKTTSSSRRDNSNRNRKSNRSDQKPRSEAVADDSSRSDQSNASIDSPESSINSLETTAPKRIGLNENSEYSPAAALDEALKASELKRTEDNIEDRNKLAEELNRSLSQESKQDQTQADVATDSFDDDLQYITQPTSMDTLKVTQQDASQTDTTIEAVGGTTEVGSFQQAQDLAVSSNQYPQPQSSIESQIPSLPPVQSNPSISQVKQSNSPIAETPGADSGPTFGGVLNATTESAAEAKRLAEGEMRNRTILNRSTPGSAPQGNLQQEVSQATGMINTATTSSVSGSMPDFNVAPSHQVFEQAENDNTYQPQTIVPPTPTGTLEEIDRQNRQPIDDGEVRDMFDFSAQPIPAPSVPIGQPVYSAQTPNTPPPPPMPDFSQLPPLPAQMPDFSQVPAQIPPHGPDFTPDNLGQILPSAPPEASQYQQPGDPNQFQIPSQQQ